MRHSNEEIIKYINKESYILCAQGIVDIEHHRVEGIEVLTRIIKDDGNFIYPDEFLPLIKEKDGLYDFDLWVIEHTFDMIKKYKSSFDDKVIHINVDTVTLSDHRLYEWLENKEAPLPKSQIVFEILEHSGSLEMLEVINKIIDLGYLFAIDDFGTGYSSFERIRGIGATYIKIDKIFMDHMTERVEDLLILKHMIDMAQNLNFKVVAEGIEYLEQLEFLFTRKCFLIQGFLFSKPIPFKNFINDLDSMEENIKKTLLPLVSENIRQKKFYHQGRVFTQDINKFHELDVPNLQLCHYLNYPLKSYEAIKFSDLLPDDYKTLWFEFIEDVMNSGEEKALMFPLIDYNNKTHHVLSVVQRHKLLSGVRIYLEFLEVLEEGTLSLMGLSKSYTQAFKYAPVGIMILSDNFLIEKWNKAAKAIFGYKSMEITGKSAVKSLMTPSDHGNFQKLLIDSHKQSVATKIIKGVKKDNSTIQGKWQISMIGKQSDAKVKYVCMIEDVTEKLKQEQTIKRVYHALDNSTSMIVMTDEEGIVTYMNPQYNKLTDYQMVDFSNISYWDVLGVLENEVATTIIEEGSFEKELMISKKNKETYYAHVSIHPIKKNEMGGGFLVVQRDISEERALQNENNDIKNAMVGQSQKGSFLDLTAGLLNEINNPLSSLKTDANYLMDQWEKLESEEIREVLEDFNSSIEVLMEVIKGLESVRQDLHLDAHVVIDFKELVQEVLEYTKSVYYYDVSLTFKFDAESNYLIIGNPGELKQSISHLIMNAVEAIKKNKNDQGRLQIELIELERHIGLIIQDNGVGMTDDTLKMIYEPLFTTDKNEKSGLGLSVVKRVVEAYHHGSIVCDSHINKGTIFKILLPRMIP